jgi:hypothetical protein
MLPGRDNDTFKNLPWQIYKHLFMLQRLKTLSSIQIVEIEINKTVYFNLL